MKLLNYIHYQNLGKPTLVILHGLLGSSDNWRTISKKMANNFNIYCFDIRNHGESFHDTQMSYELMAKDVCNAIDYLGLEVDYLIGHSMGGKIVIRIIQELSYIKKAIIVDIAPVKYQSHHQDVLQALEHVRFQNCTNRSDLDLELSQFVLNVPTRQLLMKNIRRLDNGDFFWKCNHQAIINAYTCIMDISHLNKQISTPTLFVKGGDSEYIKDSDLAQIDSLFFTSNVVSIDNVGHWVQAQAPEKFMQICIDFFK